MESLKQISDESVSNCDRHVQDIEKWFCEKEGLQECNPTPFIIPLEDEEFEEWEQESDEELDPDEEINVWD